MYTRERIATLQKLASLPSHLPESSPESGPAVVAWYEKENPDTLTLLTMLAFSIDLSR